MIIQELVDRDVVGGGDVPRVPAGLLPSGGPELVTAVLRLGSDVQDRGARVFDRSLDVLTPGPQGGVRLGEPVCGGDGGMRLRW